MGFFLRMIVVGVAASAAGTHPVSGRENLLRNGSFEEMSSLAVETRASHWNDQDPDAHGGCWGSASRENWRAVEGEYIGAIRGLWANGGDAGGVWQEVRATAGQSYRFSAWLFCDPEWSANTQEIRIEFWDEACGRLVGMEKQAIQECDVEWTQRAVTATAPEGASWVRVVIRVEEAGASGALQFDNLVLTREEGSTADP